MCINHRRSHYDTVLPERGKFGDKPDNVMFYNDLRVNGGVDSVVTDRKQAM